MINNDRILNHIGHFKIAYYWALTISDINKTYKYSWYSAAMQRGSIKKSLYVLKFHELLRQNVSLLQERHFLARLYFTSLKLLYSFYSHFLIPTSNILSTYNTRQTCVNSLFSIIACDHSTQSSPHHRNRKLHRASVHASNKKHIVSGARNEK